MEESEDGLTVVKECSNKLQLDGKTIVVEVAKGKEREPGSGKAYFRQRNEANGERRGSGGPMRRDPLDGGRGGYPRGGGDDYYNGGRGPMDRGMPGMPPPRRGNPGDYPPPPFHPLGVDFPPMLPPYM